ncbi:hypothetical protein predicted by Glimmer/Critica (plasmid) [Sinorhizobium fredii HH103]|uniref:Uncharacterized protein n=1 Tax=Sinorhizobium fredii (strain HH103) TaxID=1117943 RepID=G9AHT3_SINF1|nr:hypothetical protein predicted by Glimmer/Critica [Sinorhizobium fredii HH103]
MIFAPGIPATLSLVIGNVVTIGDGDDRRYRCCLLLLN